MWPARILSRSFALLFSFVATTFLVLLQPASLRSLPAVFILINEIDASTPGTDTAEFVELYDGGTGNTSLDGLVLVFFNGQDDRSYHALDLSGYQTDADGYFLAGNQSVVLVDLPFADNLLQDGPDAVALYQGAAGDFPNGTAVSTSNLQDAIVYDSDDPDDAGLLSLLLPNQPQVDEDSLTLADFHSSQRCPDGGGGARQTVSYIQELPTPKGPNRCPIQEDEAPSVAGTMPAPAEADVPPEANIIISFSEAVVVAGDWYQIACSESGEHDAVVNGDGIQITLNPAIDLAYGETCTVTLFAEQITDLDLQDPPDHMTADYSWSFAVASPAVAGGILINEIDSDTSGSDTAEFIELYDGGGGATRLDGLVVVLFNGNGDMSYRAIDLDGYATSSQGYFLIGSTGVNSVDLAIPDSVIQNGPDAVALYEGHPSDFPSGTPVTTVGLRDAIVYGTDDSDDSGLLTLLKKGQPQVDEAQRAQPALDSNQRCPNGAGGARETTTYLQNLPTPRSANKCTFDAPPVVASTSPADGQSSVARTESLTVRFSEDVRLEAGALELACTSSGTHTLTIAGGPSQYTATPSATLGAGEICTAAVVAAKVSDLDVDDPPDHMAQDYRWSFTTKDLPVASDILINEVDADTAGADKAEFIELFDGGRGATQLDGLVLVLYNGYDDRSYRAIDLDGYKTDEDGYFVAGGRDVPGVELSLADSSIQNGADAVVLYAADGADFPPGSSVRLDGLIDAFVYDTDDEDDPGLLALLQSGQPQVNESSRGSSDVDASQRCPNGGGGQRATIGFLQNPPTPGMSNNCVIDTPSTGECGDRATPLSMIQGTGLISPLAGARDVVIEAIVAADFQGSERLNGFYVQSKAGEEDGDSQTSEGLFILRPEPVQNLSIGEIVRLRGNVDELDGLTTLSSSGEVERCGSTSLPPPVELALPLGELDDWEQVESMRISLPQGLHVTGSAQLATAGILDLSAADRLYAPTAVASPGDPALAVASLNSRSRIMLDDGSSLQPPAGVPPYLASDGTVRAGDRINGLEGILSESDGGYRIHPSEEVTIARSNNRSAPPARQQGSVRVALFDTGGYFNGDGLGSGFPGPFGAGSADEFTRQRDKVITALRGMEFDIAGLLSLENDGSDANGVLQDLVIQLNETPASGSAYDFIQPVVPELGDAGMVVGLLYRTERVAPSGTTAFIVDASPAYPTTIVLNQRFTVVGGEHSLLVAVANFPGRGSCPLDGSPDADQGDGQGCWNARRISAAEMLTQFLDNQVVGDVRQEQILLLGNLNAYAYEDPLTTLAAASYVNLTTAVGEPTYNTVIDGQAGALLHVLAAPLMSPKIVNTLSWHINADEPPLLDYRLSNPPDLFTSSAYRSAEHDPLLVEICMDAERCRPAATFLPVVLGE